MSTRAHGSAPPPAPAPGGPALLSTKIAPPRVSAAAIRGETLDAIEAGGHRRLLLVTAPAGYGKTTVVANAAERLGWASAWYKLDVLDHDPRVLVSSLTAAVKHLAPDFGEILLERFASAKEHPLAMPEMMAIFLKELDEEIDFELHLVLDDYHEASGSAELNMALDFLLGHLPDHVHIVLLTRYEPLFGTAKLQLDGDLERIDYRSLRFDAPQAREFLSEAAGRSITELEADRLLLLTEGWPASLVLVGRALGWTDLTTVERALGDPRLKQDLFSYLAEQVYVRVAPDVRVFLKHTCPLEYMTAELANEVAGIDTAPGYLAHLEANQIFTFADAGRSTYRYHPLFREYLRTKCTQEDGASAFRALQLKAARALERYGDWEAAVECFLSANEAGAATELAARLIGTSSDNCTLDTLRSWVDRLPRKLLDGDASTLLLAGQTILREGDFAAAIETLTDAETRFGSARDQEGMYRAASAIEYALFWQGDMDGAARWSRTALDLGTSDEERAHSILSLGAALTYSNRPHECDHLWSEAERLLPRTSPERARVAGLRGMGEWVRGRFGSALEHLRQGAQMAARTGPRSLEAAMLNAFANALLSSAYYAEAEAQTRRSLDTCIRYGYENLHHVIEDTLGLLLVARGQTQEGIRILESASARTPLSDVYARAMACSHLGTAQRRLGELRKATVLYEAGAALAETSTAALPVLNCRANLQFTRGLIADRQACDKLLDIRSHARAHGFAFVEHKCTFFAELLRLQGQPPLIVTEALLGCVEEQLSLGHIHFLCQELALQPELAISLIGAATRPETASGLVGALSRTASGVAVLARVLKKSETVALAALSACAEHAEPGDIKRLATAARRSRFAAVRQSAGRLLSELANEEQPEVAPFAQLTRRETEILALMSAGYRNPEIAQRLFVSPTTVKTHVNRIFSKLEVTDRVQAVLRYRERSDSLVASRTPTDAKASSSELRQKIQPWADYPTP